MIKRILIGTAATLGILLVVLLVWQPRGLQQHVLKLIIDQIEESTPYKVEVKSVSGNFFTRISLNGIRVYVKGAAEDLLAAKALTIGVRWRALLDKKVEVTEVALVNPTLRLRLLKDHRIDLPAMPPSKQKTSSKLPVLVEHLELRNGRIIMTNAALRPVQELTLEPVNLTARLSPNLLKIDELSAGLDKGRLKMKGGIALPSGAVDLALAAHAFPIHQLLKLAMAPPKPLRLSYSGEGRIERKEHRVKASLQGRLEDAPLMMKAELDLRGRSQADITLESLRVSRVWADPTIKKDVGKISASLRGSNRHKSFNRLDVQGDLHLTRGAPGSADVLSAHLEVTEGQGPISWGLNLAGLTSSGTAKVDLPAQTSEGRFELSLSSFSGLAEFVPAVADAEGKVEASGSWQGPLKSPAFKVSAEAKALRMENRSVAQMNVTASGDFAKSRALHVEAKAKDALLNAPAETPWDIREANLTLEKSSAAWRPVLAAKFRNEASLEYSGSLQSAGAAWQITWDKLVLTPSRGAALETLPGGGVSRAADGAIDVRGLVLASGEGRLFVDRARLRDSVIDLVLHSNQWDPSGLVAFIPDGVIEPGGFIRVNGKIAGRYPQIDVDGDFAAELPHIAVPGVGLNFRNFKADIHSQGRTLTVRRFTAESKKGSIEMTGESTLPALNFTLVGKKVPIDIPKSLEAETNFRIRLEGTIQGPDIRGRVFLVKAVYQVPKKTKKQKEAEKAKKAGPKPPPSPVWMETTMDVHAEWPRNVWYRDGLSKIETSGDLRVQKDKGTASPYLAGSISIVRGIYSAYGRDFILSSGDIAFLGPPDINPVFNIEATYTTGGTVVYLDLKGTLKVPELSLRSNPPLPQQDIISVLVLGRPMNELQPNSAAGPAAGTSTQDEAAALAGSVVSGMVTTQLRESGMDIGLDVVRVEPTTQGSVLMVGRYIGSKLFVSYGQPLQATAARAYEAQYYINPNWTLEGESGTPDTAQANPTSIDNHIGFQFRYPLNTPKHQRKRFSGVAQSSTTATRY